MAKLLFIGTGRGWRYRPAHVHRGGGDVRTLARTALARETPMYPASSSGPACAAGTLLRTTIMVGEALWRSVCSAWAGRPRAWHGGRNRPLVFVGCREFISTVHFARRDVLAVMGCESEKACCICVGRQCSCDAQGVRRCVGVFWLASGRRQHAHVIWSEDLHSTAHACDPCLNACQGTCQGDSSLGFVIRAHDRDWSTWFLIASLQVYKSLPAGPYGLVHSTLLHTYIHPYICSYMYVHKYIHTVS